MCQRDLHRSAREAFQRGGGLVLLAAALFVSLACADPLAEALEHYRADRFEDAVAACDEAIRAEPSRRAYAVRGASLMALERWEDALDSFDAGIRIDPSQATDHAGRAEVLRALGRHEEALAGFEEAVRRDPTHVLSRVGLAIVLRGLGRYEDAAAAFDEAERVDASGRYQRMIEVEREELATLVARVDGG